MCLPFGGHDSTIIVGNCEGDGIKDGDVIGEWEPGLTAQSSGGSRSRSS